MLELRVPPREPTKGMTTMRPLRPIATALLIAGLAVASCGRSQPDEAATPADQPPAVTAAPAPNTPASTGGPTNGQPVVLVDGRHTIYLKAVDPNRRTIRFDLIQFYGGDEAIRQAAKDHPEASPDRLRQWVPNDFYIRNVNPRLRTLPVRSDAAITVITLAWNEGPADSQRIVPVSLAKLAVYMPAGERPFSITVRHGQVVKLAEVFVP
jgi:hypothetical protein